MKKNVTLLVIILALLGHLNPARATHILGGEIFYDYVSPGVLLASFRNYIDPSAGITVDSTVQFSLKAPGCSNQAFMYTGSRKSIVLKDYNSGGPAVGTCTRSQLSILEATYTATITLPAGIAGCTNWFLSVRQCQKSPTVNLQNPGTYCLFVSASINIFFLNTPVSSPAFTSPIALQFPLNAPATFSNLTRNNLPATDTVIYSLKPVQDDFNVPVPYTANTSATAPIPSSNGVNIHQNTGLLTFTPNTWNPVANNYGVMVDATVFRLLNGAYVKVSSSQRHLPLYISNAPNASPEIVNVTANGQVVAPGGVVEVLAGSTVTFSFATSDANATDILTLLPPDPAYGNFNLTSSGSIRPTGTVTWQAPAVADNKVYYFPVSVQDNSCPVRATTTRIFGVKVVNQLVGFKKDQRTGVDFTAYPNPFSSELTFSFSGTGAAELVICDLLGRIIDRISLPHAAGRETLVRWERAEHFPEGTYLARLIADGKPAQVLKFTKQ